MVFAGLQAISGGPFLSGTAEHGEEPKILNILNTVGFFTILFRDNIFSSVRSKHYKGLNHKKCLAKHSPIKKHTKKSLSKS